MPFGSTTRARTIVKSAAVLAAMLGVGSCADVVVPPPGTVIVHFHTVLAGEVAFTWGLSVDGGKARSINSADSGSFTLASVAAGDRVFNVTSLTKGCTSGADERIVTVPSADTARITVVVSCPIFTSTVHVTVTQSGTPVDPDGFILTVGKGLSTTLKTIPTTAFRSFAPGTATVALTGLEPNCSVGNANPVVTAARHDTVNVAFAVTCGPYAVGTLSGTFVDPIADTLANATSALPAAFDIDTIRTRYAPGLLTFTIKFTRAIPTVTPWQGFIDMDLDQDPSTLSFRTTVNDYGGNSNLGVDAYIVHSGFLTSIDTLWTAVAGIQFPTLIRSLAGGDSIQFYVPLEKLRDDGNLNFASIVGTDRAMDLMMNAGVMTTHAPGTIAPTATQSSKSQASLAGALDALRPPHVRWLRRR